MFGLGNKTRAYENIEVDQFSALMENKDAVVLDVRTPAEKSDGIIPGYKLINIMDPSFEEEVSKLDKDKTYLVYCRSGNRSGQACGIMADMGFKNLYNLMGGIGAWNSTKGKIVD